MQSNRLAWHTLNRPTRRVAGLVGLIGLVTIAAMLLGGSLAGAQTSVTLASNLSQANGVGFGFGHEHGQLFTTGSNAGGYKLTHVDLDLTIADPSGVQPTYRLELWSVNSSSNPAAKLATLTNPSSLTTGARTWTAPNSGVDLAANTSYIVLFDILPPNGSIGVTVASTASTTEDSGSWAIGNRAHFKGKSDPTWTRHGSNAMQIRVRGYNKSAPSTPIHQPPPDPPNLARGVIQLNTEAGGSARTGAGASVALASVPSSGRKVDRVSGVHAVPVTLSEIRSNQPSGATGWLDLSAITASVSEDLRRHSRGFYLTVLVESASGNRYLFRRLDYELARGAPLLKVHIWHVYRHVGRGTNTLELLGEVFGGRAADRLAEPVEICLPAPAEDTDRAQIAVRGRLDPAWTILESHLTFDGRICAETTRVAWFTIVLEPEPESQAA